MNQSTALATHLPSISLEELNAEAELMTRVDRKYLVPLEVARSVVAEQKAELRALEIAGQREFAYSSRYFDTESLDSYRASATGRRHRFKVRMRTYEDSQLSFLEVKTRTGRGESAKTRIEMGPQLSGDFLSPAARSFVDQALGAARFPYRPAALSTTLSTSYRRTTLLHSEGSRLTIDLNLQWCRPHSQQVLRTHNLVIVETKSSYRPGAIDRALWRRGHRPDRISKYATGLALVQPELASNRWHRTLGTLSSHITAHTPTHRAN